MVVEKREEGQHAKRLAVSKAKSLYDAIEESE
jgi:hypothetical protein